MPCGPNSCGPGFYCCNAGCGICIAPGQVCPDIACGTGGRAGAGGFGGSGSCGTPGACVMQLAGTCPQRSTCTCSGCLCEVAACERDVGCQQIIACALKTNCTGPACYTPQTCQSVIDRFGINSPSFNLALAVDNCGRQRGCDGLCNVDAGPACALPPPPAPGTVGCSGSASIDGRDCSEECRDSSMNDYIAKCSNGTCFCYYNGKQTCACPMSQNGMCASCCPVWR